MRVRRSYCNNNYEYTLTIKSGYGLERNEHEISILKETYEQLNINGKISIEKCRHSFECGDLTIELDIYINIPLIIAEIEFSSIDEAINLPLPDWATEEVTNDKRYKNQYLWMKINNITALPKGCNENRC